MAGFEVITEVSGQTHQTNVQTIAGIVANGSVIANIDPQFDDCSSGRTIAMTSLNIGDLLNNKGITWGWFYGDFAPVSITNGQAACTRQYDGHYDPFQYYQSTANPHHLPPSSIAMIGQIDQANHQYSLDTFWSALDNGTLPAVSFLKAPSTETGHPNTSDPLSEQRFLVQTINRLMNSAEWNQMAIMITYDDSDGWYDHVMPPIVNQSNDSANDALVGAAGTCGTPKAGAYLDRCGYGERLPFLLISPFAKQNYVDSAVNDTTSILRFIEDNWQLGRIGDQSFDALAGSLLNIFNFSGPAAPRLILDPETGLVVSSGSLSSSNMTIWQSSGRPTIHYAY